jgi:hypothetical protein
MLHWLTLSDCCYRCDAADCGDFRDLHLSHLDVVEIEKHFG